MAFTSYKNRNFGLDLIRAIAITLVLIGHLYQLIKHYLPDYGYYTWILSYSGVELFFVLSGFLIGRIFIKTIEKNNFTFNDIKIFLFRRWLRTIPPYIIYYTIYVLMFSLILNYGSIYEVFKNTSHYLFFLQTAYHVRIPNKFFDVSWSLVIEEYFYLLFPLFVSIFYFLFPKSKKRILLLSIIVFLSLFILLRLLAVLKLDLELRDIRIIAFYRLDSIIYGVLGAFFSYYYKTWWESIANFSFFLGLGGIMVYMLIYYYNPELKEFLLAIFYLPFVSFSFLLIFPWILKIKRFRKKVLNDIIKTFSIISYSMYMVHILVRHLLIYYLEEYYLSSLTITLIVILTYFFISFIFAYLSYKKIELFFINLRKKID